MNRIQSLSVSGRLLAGFGFLLALLVALAGLSAFELTRASQRMNQIVDVNNHRTDLARDLLDQINGMAIQTRTIALLTDMPGIDQELKDLQATVAAYARTEAALVEALSSLDPASQERQLLAEVAALGKKTLPQLQSAAQLGADGDNVAATMTLTQKVRPTETPLRAKVADFVKLQGAATAAAVAEARAARERAFAMGAVLVLVALASGGLVAWRTIVSIRVPITNALKVAERIAQGDLTSSIPPAADGVQHGAVHRHRAPERRLGPSGQPAGGHGLQRGHARR
jgi:methyl-accepting chemotaxis protein